MLLIEFGEVAVVFVLIGKFCRFFGRDVGYANVLGIRHGHGVGSLLSAKKVAMPDAQIL